MIIVNVTGWGGAPRATRRLPRRRIRRGRAECVAVGGQALAALIDAQPRVYPGAPDGVTDTHKEEPGADLLEFLNATNDRAADESHHVHT
jgi:hypothetical protein